MHSIRHTASTVTTPTPAETPSIQRTPTPDSAGTQRSAFRSAMLRHDRATSTGSSRSRTTCSIAARSTPDWLGARNGPMSAYSPTYAPYPVAPSVRPRSMNDSVEDTRAAPWSRSAQKVSPLCFVRRLVMRLMARSGSSVPIGQLASLVWRLDAQQTDHRAHAVEHQAHAIRELGRLAASKECAGPLNATLPPRPRAGASGPRPDTRCRPTTSVRSYRRDAIYPDSCTIPPRFVPC